MPTLGRWPLDHAYAPWAAGLGLALHGDEVDVVRAPGSYSVVSMPKIIDIDERRQELNDAAARLIARAGLGAATLREVAAEAGLTTGAITHYFADKRELLHSTFVASIQLRRARRPDDRPTT